MLSIGWGGGLLTGLAHRTVILVLLGKGGGGSGQGTRRFGGKNPGKGENARGGVYLIKVNKT